MSTPADQYIPEEFQHEIDLPAGGVDQAAVDKANADLTAEKTKGNKYTASIDAANKQIKTLQAQLKNKKLTTAQRAKISAQVTAQQKFVAAQTKLRSASVTQQGVLQNKVYEASGEYDKLLSGANRDAFLALKSLFNGFGLGSLAGKIYDFVKQGYGADTIGLLLQDTKEYKARFAGNEARAKAGLAVLNPAEYLETEKAYRQILSSAGLPKGFYDNPADFANWIGGDVSPTEIQKRVEQAVAWTSQADPATKQALKSMYGVDSTYLVAYALDQSRALPLLQKQARAAEIGAAAIRRGFAASRTDFENLATYGITGEQAEQGFAQIKDTYDSMQSIARRFGLTWDQQEAEQEVFTPGVGNALQKGKGLRSQERALFAGSQGSSIQGLNAGYRQT
jgi:hypothetical protein